MNEQDILRIVEESFDTHVYATATGWSFDGTPTGDLKGKDDFINEITEKLRILFIESDLSK